MFKLTPAKRDGAKIIKKNVDFGISKTEDILDLGPTAVFHSTEVQGKNLSDSFFYDENKWLTVVDGSGKQEYFSRKGTVKKAIAWGQLKLFLAELTFLNKYWDPSVVPTPLCVYVGAAPGFHIRMLAKMFPKITFHLYDGRAFSSILATLPNVKTFVQLFTDEDAKKYASRNDVFFISDIRTLNYNTGYVDNEETQRLNESIVDRDMKLQMGWVQVIKPVKAHLKFRLPYTYEWNKETSYTYLDGDVYKQPWSKPTSTETRIVVDLSLPFREWNFRSYEQMLFYHNNVVREHIKFVNPLTNIIEPISSELGLLNDYDSVVFTTQVRDYLIKFGISNPTPNQVLLLCREIINDVGSNRINIVNIRSGAAVSEEIGEEE